MSDEIIINLLGNGKLNGETKKRAMELLAQGQEIGASPELMEAIVSEYLKTPEIWNWAYLQKKLLVKGWGMPDSAINSKLTTGDIMDLAAYTNVVKDDYLEVLQDERTWKLIQLRGRSGKKEIREIVKEVWAKELGIPEDVIFRLDLDNMAKVVENLQLTGAEGAITRPEFWMDYEEHKKKGLSPKFFLQWSEKLEREEEQARKKRDKELAERLRNIAQTRKSLSELDELPEKDRKKQGLEAVKKKRKKRRRRKRKLKAQVSTVPGEIKISNVQQVATPWGDNYFVQGFSDGRSILFKIENGKKIVVLEIGYHAYQVSQHGSGLPYVIPVIGRRTANRRSSPMDLPTTGRRGPTGLD